MKKIILCTLITLVLFFVVSCDVTDAKKNTNINANNDTVKEEKTMDDIYFFRTGNDSIRLISGEIIYGKAPVKINPVKKTVSSICLDPLCDHRVDCPLYTTKDIHIDGTYLFYIEGVSVTSTLTNDKTGSVNLLVYDMINGNSRKIAEYRDNFIIVGEAGSYLYYYLPMYNEEDTTHVDYILYRADAKTGNVIEMPLYEEYSSIMDGTAGNTDYPSIYAINNNKIYWHVRDKINTSAMVYYTTDFEGTNKEMLEYTGNFGMMNGKYSGGYFYYGVIMVTMLFEDFMNASGSDLQRSKLNNNIYRIPLDGSSEAELIAESVMTYTLLGDKVYYTVLEGEAEAVEYCGIETFNWSGGKVYVMNSDGTDKQLLCETGHDLSNVNGYFEAKTIDGIDYIALSFNIEAQNYSSGYTASSDTIIINASTGEYTVVSVPE